MGCIRRMWLSHLWLSQQFSQTSQSQKKLLPRHFQVQGYIYFIFGCRRRNMFANSANDACRLFLLFARIGGKRHGFVRVSRASDCTGCTGTIHCRCRPSQHCRNSSTWAEGRKVTVSELDTKSHKCDQRLIRGAFCILLALLSLWWLIDLIAVHVQCSKSH